LLADPTFPVAPECSFGRGSDGQTHDEAAAQNGGYTRSLPGWCGHVLLPNQYALLCQYREGGMGCPVRRADPAWRVSLASVMDSGANFVIGHDPTALNLIASPLRPGRPHSARLVLYDPTGATIGRAA